MLISAHVLIGALTGRAFHRPSAAFAAGVASHFLADTTPHWGDQTMSFRDRRFLLVAVPDGLVGLALLGHVVRATPPARRPVVLAAMVGACLPDADKPSGLLFGRSPWPAQLDRWHARIQDEKPSRLPRDIAVLAGLLALWSRTQTRTQNGHHPGAAAALPRTR